MLQRMFRAQPVRHSCVLILLALLLAACSAPGGTSPKPPPAADSGSVTPSPTPEPAPPVVKPGPSPTEARLMLTLPISGEYRHPGRLEGRVGGVSPRGPSSFAVTDQGDLWFLDVANLRLLQYNKEGQPAASVPVPWLGENVQDLYLDPAVKGRLSLRWGEVLFRMDSAGDLIAPPHSGEQEAIPPARWRLGLDLNTKGPVQLGPDHLGRGYEVQWVDDRYEVRRLEEGGRVLARARLPEGAPNGWYLTPGGGVYVMQEMWDGGTVHAVQVYEVMAPTEQPPQMAPPEGEPAVALDNLLPPDQIRLEMVGAHPVTVTEHKDLNNIWWLLAALTDGDGPNQAPPDRWNQAPDVIWMTATWPDGQTREMALWQGQLVWDGKLWDGGGGGPALGRLLRAILHRPGMVAEGIRRAQAVRVTIPDLPGIARSLSPEQAEELASMVALSLQGHFYSTPQPLEEPFPRLALELQGEGVASTIIPVRGGMHLSFGHESPALLLDPMLEKKLYAWMPTPEAEPGDLAYLYRATSLTITQGGSPQDLTRWKATVVRYLTGALDGQPHPPDTAPFTLTFLVDGQEQKVEVDASGFTYAGKRYERADLMGIVWLQGVP